MEESTMRGIIFVGQAPGKTGSPDEPLLGGFPGKKLCSLFRLSHEEFKACKRVNLNRVRMYGNGCDGFDRIAGKAEAERILRETDEDLVILGKEAANAFGLEYVPLAVHRLGERRFLILPHPSGRCRWWNDPRNRDGASAACLTFSTGKKHYRVRRYVATRELLKALRADVRTCAQIARRLQVSAKTAKALVTGCTVGIHTAEKVRRTFPNADPLFQA